MAQSRPMKVFAIAGYSGAGKTVLIERLIPEIIRRGWRVAVVKHSHHGFEIDRPGKDSFRHREAGAEEVMVVSPERWALMRELHGDEEPPLDALLAQLAAAPEPCDLALVEGFKSAPIPKLEVVREGTDRPPLYPFNPWVIALAAEPPVKTHLPQFAPDDAAGMADFILQSLDLETRA